MISTCSSSAAAPAACAAPASPPPMAPASGSPKAPTGAAPASMSGCVPKKLMVMAADYGIAVADSRGFGWDTQPGIHDWAAFIAKKDAEISRLNAIYVRLLTSAGCTLFDAHARFVDPHTLDVGGQRITAERIVVAVGGHPLRPDIPGGDLGIVSDQAFHLPALPKHGDAGRRRLHRGRVRRRLCRARRRGRAGLPPPPAPARLRRRPACRPRRSPVRPGRAPALRHRAGPGGAGRRRLPRPPEGRHHPPHRPAVLGRGPRPQHPGRSAWPKRASPPPPTAP